MLQANSVVSFSNLINMGIIMCRIIIVNRNLKNIFALT